MKATLCHAVLFSSLVLAANVVMAQAPSFAPVAEHALLKENEGTWDAVVTAGGSSSKGVMVNKMELGGLWLTSKFEGEIATGVKFQGQGLDGYDPSKKKFVSVWVDSMTFAPMTLNGDYDKAKKTMTMQGEGVGEDGKPSKVKSVIVHKDKDHQSFKMYAVADGKDTEMLAIEYTRRK